MRVLGLDIGGTKCAVLLADAGEKIEIIRKLRFETRTELGFAYVREKLLQAARELIGKSDVPVQAIGVSCGGPLNSRTGVVQSPPNLPGWDNILHGFSSLMLGFFGFMVITILNRDEHVMLHLSPMFSCVFAFCFALTIGCIWEIYEYTFDGLLGLNMQKFMLADGTLLVGHSALTDTMKDIIIDALGALTASVFGYISIKKDKKWFHTELTRDEEKPSKN